MYRKSARRSRPPGRSTRIASSRTSTPASRVSSAANGKLRAQPLIGRRVQDKPAGASYGWRHERCQPQTRRGASWPAGTSSGSPRRTRHTTPAPGSEPLTRWGFTSGRAAATARDARRGRSASGSAAAPPDAALATPPAWRAAATGRGDAHRFPRRGTSARVGLQRRAGAVLCHRAEISHPGEPVDGCGGPHVGGERTVCSWPHLGECGQHYEGSRGDCSERLPVVRSRLHR